MERLVSVLCGRSSRYGHEVALCARTNVHNILQETMIPITTFVPTHMCRNPKLFEEGKTWLKEGGWFDLTAEFENGQLDPVVVQSMVNLKQEGHPLERVTVSSDAFGKCL